MLSPCLYFLLQNLYPPSALSFLQRLSQVGDLTVILFQSGHYHPNSCEGKARLKGLDNPLLNVSLKDAFSPFIGCKAECLLGASEHRK